MFRTFTALLIAAVLAAPALAQSLDPVDISDNQNFDQADNDIFATVDDGEGVTQHTDIQNYGARADREGAAANNGSSAYVDNSIFQKDSALSKADLKGEISGNAVHTEDSEFEAVNKIDDEAFQDAKGVSQVSQNSGQNSLIQQNFTIQSNLKVDHSSP